MSEWGSLGQRSLVILGNWSLVVQETAGIHRTWWELCDLCNLCESGECVGRWQDIKMKQSFASGSSIRIAIARNNHSIFIWVVTMYFTSKCKKKKNIWAKSLNHCSGELSLLIYVPYFSVVNHQNELELKIGAQIKTHICRLFVPRAKLFLHPKFVKIIKTVTNLKYDPDIWSSFQLQRTLGH